MASIRRTLSPSYRSWPHQDPFSPQPPRPASLLSYSPSSPPLSSSSSFAMELRRLVSRALFLQKQPRKSGQMLHLSPWKRSSLRLLLCFLIGLLLGCFPFANIRDEMAPHHFSFEIGSPLLAHTAQRDLEVVRQGNRVIETVRADSIVTVELEAMKEEKGGSKLEKPSPRKLLIVVTPTYNRALQAYYLTRLGQTLRLVRTPLLWIVVETNSASLETADLLRRTGVMYRHLVCQKNTTSIKDRGVHQRNTALEHIERHNMDGIVYFADDDNVYSLEMFERMRETRRFGTWPVAMLAQSKSKATMEGAVCNGSQIIGWHTNETSKRLRRFHVDMSGFAFNSTILWDPNRWHRPTSDAVRQLDSVKEGFQESTFIEQVVEDESQMEAIPSGCSRIMNWHLHLESRDLVYPRGWRLLKNLEAVIPLK